MKKPAAENQKLRAIIDELWTMTPKAIGDGSMADAIRHEIATGELVEGRSHIKKGKDHIVTLEKWMSKTKRNAKGKHDNRIARAIIKDLKDALKGK